MGSARSDRPSLFTHLWRELQAFDWPLLLLFTVAGGVVLIGQDVAGVLGRLVPTLATGRFAAYEDAITAVAVRQPDGFDSPLRVIPRSPEPVLLVTLSKRTLKAKDRNFDIWAALPDELRSRCAGSKEPLLALQQILGLPPSSGKPLVVSFTAPWASLFRPCARGGAIDDDRCAATLPAEAAPTNGPPGAEDYTLLAETYNQMRFVLRQILETHRMGFAKTAASVEDYPYTGVPFTARGWTYDWNPDSLSPVGVTEFVVKRPDPISEETNQVAQTPEDFCNGVIATVRPDMAPASP